jgi:hypothetical protein
MPDDLSGKREILVLEQETVMKNTPDEVELA